MTILGGILAKILLACFSRCECLFKLVINLDYKVSTEFQLSIY